VPDRKIALVNYNRMDNRQINCW